MTRLALMMAALLCSGLAAAQSAPPYAQAARDLAASCANCHGTAGQAQGSAMVPLSGMPREVLLQKLLDYRAGKRPATLMHQIAKGYTEAQLDQIAGYFAALPPRK